MATSNGSLIQALIDGGISPPAARVIASALANAATPQFSQSRDVSDQTPIEQLRLVTGDARKYQFPNLDYSSEEPYEKTLRANPGQYVSGYLDHPYKDSQPVLPVAPLSKSRITGGDYISVENTVEENAPQATVSLNISQRPGIHVRLNPATKSLEAVPFEFESPQGLVTAEVSEGKSSTGIQLAVRQLATISVLKADGTSAGIKSWGDPSVASQAIFTAWGQANLMSAGNATTVKANLGITNWADTNLLQATTSQQVRQAIGAPLAWVRFTGATGGILGSYNVLSVTRNGVGDYTVNFATVLPTANYAAIATCTARGGGGGPGNNYSIGFGSLGSVNADSTYTTAACRLYAQRADGGTIDPATVSVAFFG